MWQFNQGVVPFHILLFGHFDGLYLNAWQAHCGFPKLLEFQNVCHQMHYTTLHSHTLQSRTGHKLAIPPCMMVLYTVFVIPQHVGMCRSAVPCLCITLDPHRRTYSTVPLNTFDGLLKHAYKYMYCHQHGCKTFLHVLDTYILHHIAIHHPFEFTLSTTLPLPPPHTATSQSGINHQLAISHPARGQEEVEEERDVPGDRAKERGEDEEKREGPSRCTTH